MDKQKLLDVLKRDLINGDEQLLLLNPTKSRSHAVSYHVVADEIEYIETLIAAIESGIYD